MSIVCMMVVRNLSLSHTFVTTTEKSRIHEGVIILQLPDTDYEVGGLN